MAKILNELEVKYLEWLRRSVTHPCAYVNAHSVIELPTAIVHPLFKEAEELPDWALHEEGIAVRSKKRTPCDEDGRVDLEPAKYRFKLTHVLVKLEQYIDEERSKL